MEINGGRGQIGRGRGKEGEGRQPPLSTREGPLIIKLCYSHLSQIFFRVLITWHRGQPDLYWCYMRDLIKKNRIFLLLIALLSLMFFLCAAKLAAKKPLYAGLKAPRWEVVRERRSPLLVHFPAKRRAHVARAMHPPPPPPEEGDAGEWMKKRGLRRFTILKNF
uniref:Uncharacterized protein n=1 Tax=Morchella brunnea TaxID=1174671 RepID=A0A8K1MHA7_9PEZI|nr:hypothetical protein LK370_mgp212 [Morchella brunnea]UBU98491.1 hypothetical protein [Morchella brunnea]